MIEIKEGWTATEADDQFRKREIDYQIAQLNKKLGEALEARAKIQSTCQHRHVLLAGQDMTCEVCGARIDR